MGVIFHEESCANIRARVQSQETKLTQLRESLRDTHITVYELLKIAESHRVV